MQPNKQITLPQAIARAIAYTENGGKPNLNNPSAGKSGEMKSIFQYTPDTWTKDSEEVFGKSGVPLTNDTEGYVTVQKITQWLKKGYTPSQIFSMWNAGVGEPDAYTGKFSNGQPSTGTNKENVPYSVQAYVKKADNYLKQFMPEVQEGNLAEATPSQEAPSPTNLPTKQPDISQPANPSTQATPQNQASSVTPEQYKNSIATIVSLVKKGQSKPPGTTPGMLPPTSVPQTA